MIAANGVTARYLEAKGFPSLRRVVRSRPSGGIGSSRWRRTTARSCRRNPDSKALAQVSLAERRAADPVRFPDLSLTIVKLMGPGEYAVEFPGERPRATSGWRSRTTRTRRRRTADTPT